MEANSISFVLGAAGAVLATLFFATLDGLWARWLLPLWRRWRYRGVNIGGRWKGLGSGSAPACGEWTEVGLLLEQQAREVRGFLRILRCSEQRTSELRVAVAGTVAARCVTLAASSAAGATAGHATALLQVDAHGSCLVGQLLYRDAETGGIECIHLSVYPASSMALPRLRPLAGLQAATGGAA